MRTKVNKGARRLQELYPDQGGVKAIGELCGVHQSVASRWRSGERTPETKHRVKLSEEHGIPLLDWEELEVGDEPAEPAAE